MSEYAQRESSSESGTDSSSETASAAQSTDAGQSNQAVQDELNSVRTVVGGGGYTYQQSADGSITIIAGPTSVGVQLAAGQPGWQAITDEIGAWSGAAPTGAVEQSSGPSAAEVVSSRTVEGGGGYVYQQFEDGSIVIVGGPTSVGVKIAVGQPGWQAITNEIGAWAAESAPPAVAETVEPAVVENATEESSGSWLSGWLDSVGDAVMEMADDVVEEVSSWWETDVAENEAIDTEQVASARATEVAEIVEESSPEETSGGGYFSHPNANAVSVSYGPNAVALNTNAEHLLRSILAEAGLSSGYVSSTLRTYADQARINYEQNSESQILSWYGADVHATWVQYKNEGKSTAEYADYLETRDQTRGRVMSKHLSGLCLDVAPHNGSFSDAVGALVPVAGSGVRTYLVEKGCTHTEFTFEVT